MIKRYEKREKEDVRILIMGDTYKSLMNDMKEKEKRTETLKSLIVSSSLAWVTLLVSRRRKKS